MNKTQNLRHLLTELIQKHDLEPKILEQKVFALWQEHLGAPLGTKTVPVSLSSGILKVYTEYPPYRMELLFHKQQILTDLNAELGQPVLTDLRIEIRTLRAAKSDETENPSPNQQTSKTVTGNLSTGNIHQATPEELERIEQALTSVSDPQLKKSLWQLFTTQSTDKP